MRINRLYEDPNWFATFLEDHPILDCLQAGKWEVGKMISEKAQYPFDDDDIVDSIAVFHCKRVSTNKPCDAILKLKMQSVYAG